MNYNYKFNLEDIIINALKEDIGKKDITTETIIPKDKLAKAVILAKQDLVVCGLQVAMRVLKTLDKNIKFKIQAKEGDIVKKGRIIATFSGKAKSILTGERVALNFLSLLSGIATTTRKFVNSVKPFKSKIIDTRKTLPGLRILEKYAVRIGGGFNHRLSLDEMVLIKDNHLKVLGSRFWSLGLGKKSNGIKTEIEVQTLKEYNLALKLWPDVIMLDNMSIENIRKAVRIRNKLQSQKSTKSTIKLEASGGTTLKNVKQIASTGVDMISIGSLTDSINSVDISLEII